MECRIYEGADAIHDAIAIRLTVFTQEQGFVDGIDNTDADAIHAVLYDAGTPVATGRAFPASEDGVYHIGRVAVMRGWRGKGCGRRIMQALEDAARTRGAQAAHLSAQDHAVGFYERLGYHVHGEWYMEENYPHIAMEKTLG